MNVDGRNIPHPPMPGPQQIAQGSTGPWQQMVPVSVRQPMLYGALVAAVFLAGFGLWAATAPIDGAVIAPGVVQASGRNQLVEHLEGGIVATINVAEGDAVRAGQVLMTLDALRLAADRNRVAVTLVGAQAQLARAQAERAGSDTVDFSPDLLATARASGVEDDLEQQRAEFANRLSRHAAELAAIDQRKRAAEEEIEGLLIQKTAQERKLAVLRDELDGKAGLLSKGLVSKAQVNELKRAEADTMGTLGTVTANIGERRSTIAELAEQRAGMEARRREAASAEINEVRTRIGDLVEQLRTRDDMLARSEIRAPADGIVVKLAKNTVGSVIKPGEPVLELLPTSGKLLIDARVSPRDVDAIRIGQEASLRLVALNARTTPQIDARVNYVSADRIIDPGAPEPYYTARLEITGTLPPEIGPGQIQPGMPVDAYIKTGERTFLQYLARPIQDSFSKAFREE
jgi:HlyD family secretion protein